MEKLKEWSALRIQQLNFEHSRYLYDQIDWSQRLIGIMGARGVGKTTLILQRIKEMNNEDALYISLDTLYFSEHKLFDFAEKFRLQGGRYLFVDEVHKYPNWSQELKNIYDLFPDLYIVFTSSSALDIYKGNYDLSRRVVLYQLQGLSFREFLLFKYNFQLPILDFFQLLNADNQLISKYLNVLSPFKYLNEYLNAGYYPFFLEDPNNYHKRLQQAINLVIEVDLPAIHTMDFQTIVKLKRLLFIISQIAPFKPNINKLAQQIGATRDTTLKLLFYLHNAHILRWLTSDANGINFMNKPDKIYLENTNIGAAIGFYPEDLNRGTLRETFIANQLSVHHQLTYPAKGDFLVDGKILLEVGGKNKNLKQIAGFEQAFVVKDDIEFRHKNILPLWLFGFLY